MKGALARLRGIARSLGQAVAPVLAKVAAVAGGVGNLAWRGLLVTAAAGMLIGAALMAAGQASTSDAVVTAAFFLGILAVPVWLVTVALARLHAPSRVFARRRPTTERSSDDEDFSGGADEELDPHDCVLPGEPA